MRIRLNQQASGDRELVLKPFYETLMQDTRRGILRELFLQKAQEKLMREK